MRPVGSVTDAIICSVQYPVVALGAIWWIFRRQRIAGRGKGFPLGEQERRGARPHTSRMACPTRGEGQALTPTRARGRNPKKPLAKGGESGYYKVGGTYQSLEASGLEREG